MHLIHTHPHLGYHGKAALQRYSKDQACFAEAIRSAQNIGTRPHQLGPKAPLKGSVTHAKGVQQDVIQGQVAGVI